MALQQQVDTLKQQLDTVWASTGMNIPYADLDVQDQIGGGGYSLVYRGLWHGTPVAVKRWFNPQLQEEVQEEFRQEVMTLQQLRHPHVTAAAAAAAAGHRVCHKKLQSHFYQHRNRMCACACRQEVMTLQQLRHPHVVQFLGACMKPPSLCLVTEYMPHSLHSVLYEQQGVALDRKRVLSLAADAARALLYLHHVTKPAVVHRDVKPANFLLDRAWRMKLADFGLAANSSKQANAGTPSYMAPELLQPGKPYSAKVDVYAFGVMLNEMLGRSPPWAGMAAGDIRRQVLAGQRPPIDLSVPKQLQQLISACWEQQPEQRPDFVSILEQLNAMIKQV
uniref:Protein kinase domain-containing protein n=1 Tax=Tetradesmus obliquus TaxID=3088 RepID=A0A383VB83_TETOB